MDGSTRRDVRADWAPLRSPARESTAENIYLYGYDYTVPASFSINDGVKKFEL